MRKVYRNIVSFILVLSMLFCMNIPAFAAGTQEEYICELRLIYAEDYEEATEILSEGEFSDYKVLNENLNENSDEIGVWLAYKTTTNIDDAITDLAVMQMNGGYTLGNYQEMIKQSYEEYVEMGGVYLAAIEYFVNAYEEGDFFAVSAFRQLNFYNVETQENAGLDIPSFEGEKLGDIFLDGIDEYELATMFMQGNSYALDNIRALLAMGVSYNEDGMTYLEKVAEAAAEMNDNPTVFDSEDYDDLAMLISATVSTFKSMFEELGAYEDELNYDDKDYTEQELYYLEYKAIAELLRGVDYLDGKTLYQFCLEYEMDEEDYSSLYPLVAALNEGQVAMTKVAHYYDVVRYSISQFPEDVMNEQISEAEEKYAENPFNIYNGVDRSVFTGSFALTSDASRADAYTDGTGIYEYLTGDAGLSTGIAGTSGAIGASVFMFAIVKGNLLDYADHLSAVSQAYKSLMQDQAVMLGTAKVPTTFGLGDVTYEQVVNNALTQYKPFIDNFDSMMANDSFYDKYTYLEELKADYGTDGVLNSSTKQALFGKGDNALPAKLDTAWDNLGENGANLSKQKLQDMAASNTTTSMSYATAALYIVGGAMMLYSAIQLGINVYNYFHPDYEDVPLSMVDLVETVDGDRYIKYDVVYNGETNEHGVYEAGDLNAFEAQRWNALYYTKSYEAGKPLLADGFSVSNDNNKPAKDYTPVHRFGEVVCYNLNKYNFDGDTQIYLSVKQSKNDKSAVADVPEVIGSMFGAGFLVLAGGIGAIVGVGGVLATQEIIKKKKSGSAVQGEDAVPTEE